MHHSKSAVLSRAMVIAVCLCLVGVAPDCFAAGAFVPRPKPATPRGAFKPPPKSSKSLPNTGTPGGALSEKWDERYTGGKKRRAQSAWKKVPKGGATPQAHDPVPNTTRIPYRPSSHKCKDKNGMTKPCE